MGSEYFTTVATGKNPEDAFKSARNKALYKHGHEGYTGTIAEKDCFTLLEVSDNESPKEFVERMLFEDESEISEKFGPAGAIKLEPGKFVFFGWASI